MSQSDYIRYKKTTNQLKEVRKLDPILASQDYITFKQYTLESTVINTSPTFNKLALPGQKIIFGMERKISNCPISNFAICNRTNLRPNRRENPIITMFLNEKPRTNQTTIKTII
jgi:hypothetical protein